MESIEIYINHIAVIPAGGATQGLAGIQCTGMSKISVMGKGYAVPINILW